MDPQVWDLIVIALDKVVTHTQFGLDEIKLRRKLRELKFVTSEQGFLALTDKGLKLWSTHTFFIDGRWMRTAAQTIYHSSDLQLKGFHPTELEQALDGAAKCYGGTKLFDVNLARGFGQVDQSTVMFA